MLRASSLFYALILSLLVGLVTVSIISMGYYQKVELELYSRIPRLISNCQSAEAILISEHQSLKENKFKILKEFDDTTQIKIQPWGVWDVGTVMSKAYGDSTHYSFMYGQKLSYAGAALLIKNGISGLSISGLTKIKGDVYVPGARVKPAFIGGQSFTGDQLVNGAVLDSPRNFPQPPQKRVNKLRLMKEDDMDFVNFMDSPDSLSNKFVKRTVVITSNDSIAILEKQFAGNIIIESKKSIYISAFCKLKNVRCNAPRITIASGFKGSVQCSASESIIMESDSHLTYPSALIVLADDKVEDPKISVSEGALLEGVIWMNADSEGQINLENESGVIGQVISNGSAQLKGKVNGQVIVKELNLKTGSGYYVNHLLNTSIKMNLPHWFSGVEIQSKTKPVLKLLDL